MVHSPNDPNRKFILGDIILVRFPYEEDPHTPVGNGRPCMVIFQLGERVSVSFGTDLDHTANSNINDLELPYPLWRDCGLYKATRFCIKRIKNFPINATWLNFTKKRILGTIPTDELIEFKRNLLDRPENKKRVNLNVGRVGFMTQTYSPEIIITDHCVEIQNGDFSAEFWFDGEYFGDELIQEIRQSPFLTSDEISIAISTLGNVASRRAS